MSLALLLSLKGGRKGSVECLHRAENTERASDAQVDATGSDYLPC